MVLGKHAGAFPPGVRYVYAGAVLAVRVYAGLERVGYRFKGTHPPPAKRLSALREHAAHLLGGRTGYLSTSTLSFSIDRVLEAAERRLAGFDPSERKDQILANTVALIVECAANRVSDKTAARILSDDVANAMSITRHQVAEEAARLFGHPMRCSETQACRGPSPPASDAYAVGLNSTRLPTHALVPSAEQAQAYSRVSSLFKDSTRQVFLDSWAKECSANNKDETSIPPLESTQGGGPVAQYLGQSADGTKNYRLGLPVQPGSPEAHYNLALELRQKGRLEEAIAEYRTAIELKPDFQMAHNNLEAPGRAR